MLLLLLLGIAGAAVASICPEPEVEDDHRKALLKAHNDLRRTVVRGAAPNHAGNLGAGKNMYRVKYDCDLEKAAKDAVGDKCNAAIVDPPKYGQNVQMYDTQAITNLDIKELLKDAVKQWYQPVVYYGLRNNGNKYDDRRLYTFANLAYDRNTAFGCYHKKCGDKVVISCMYSNIVPDNATLYEPGAPCTKNEDCTIYDPSTCDKGLCIAKPVVSPARPNIPSGSTGAPDNATSTPAMCPNPEMTDAIRQRILKMHNDFRSQLARGFVRNGRIGNCPTAANMNKLDYDCGLESSALTHAKACSLTSSTTMGENVYSGTLTDDLQNAAETALEQWWNSVSISGVNPSMLFRARVRDKENSPKAFTQMGWGKTSKVGCAVVKCPSNTFTVCRYSEVGNVVDQYVYKQGRICGECLSRCDISEGLCRTS